MVRRGKRLLVLLVAALMVVAVTACILDLRRVLVWDGQREAVFRFGGGGRPGGPGVVESISIDDVLLLQRRTPPSGAVDDVFLPLVQRHLYRLPGRETMTVRATIRYRQAGLVEVEKIVSPPLVDVCSLWINIGPNRTDISDCHLVMEFD